MKFNIPAYSQYLDIKNKEWQDKSCGIVALKSILDFWSDKTKKKYPDGDKLIEIGLGLNAYISGIGWRHKELIEIAKSFGLDGENFDWVKNSSEEAFQKMLPYLEKYPLAVSVHPLFETQNQGGHLVVLTGFEPAISSVTGTRFKPAKLRLHEFTLLQNSFYDNSDVPTLRRESEPRPCVGAILAWDELR